MMCDWCQRPIEGRPRKMVLCGITQTFDADCMRKVNAQLFEQDLRDSLAPEVEAGRITQEQVDEVVRRSLQGEVAS